MITMLTFVALVLTGLIIGSAYRRIFQARGSRGVAMVLLGCIGALTAAWLLRIEGIESESLIGTAAIGLIGSLAVLPVAAFFWQRRLGSEVTCDIGTTNDGKGASRDED